MISCNKHELLVGNVGSIEQERLDILNCYRLCLLNCFERNKTVNFETETKIKSFLFS